jgi:hypothetical protein
VYGLSAKTGAIEVQSGYLDGNGATPAVRIVQLVAEQFADLPHPVPDRLRVDG